MLELFESTYCPYCRIVGEVLDELKIPYTSRYREDPEQRERLLTLGGKNQVPFLYSKEKNIAMYESQDIIQFLREHVTELQ